MMAVLGRFPRSSIVLTVAKTLAVTGYASGGQQSLGDGVLRVDIGHKAFRTEWGLPEQTLAAVSADLMPSLDRSSRSTAI